MKKIIILTKIPNTPSYAFENIGMLYESASDSEINLQYPQAITIQQLIGDAEHARKLGSELATKILQDEPKFRGIPQLTIFHEVLSSQLHNIFHVIHLHDYLLDQGYEECEFIETSSWGEDLHRYAKLTKSALKVVIPATLHKIRFKRCIDRLAATKFSFNAIRSEVSSFINIIDPFHLRTLLSNKFRSNKILQHKPWFYTTAVNYTAIGLAYEPSFSEPLNYLVENNLTGGKLLRERKRAYAFLYQFAKKSFIPQKEDVEKTAKIIFRHLLSISLTDKKDLVARKFLLKSPWIETFFTRLLPQGLYTSSIIENWITLTQPSLVVVGNQVFEGYALYKAREKNIPTILLQHGVIADYYAYADHPIDYYVVRGKFFYDRLSSCSQQRALIDNPVANTHYPKTTKNSIVFMTMPIHLKSPAIDFDVESILLALLESIKNKDVTLMVRVHPLERVETYKVKIDQLLKQKKINVKVEFSQGKNLDEIIAAAYAVVMFGSTVFLDCVKHNVPIISFDWHDFGFKKNIQQYNTFYFAKDLRDLSKLVNDACNKQLSFEVKQSNDLLDNSGSNEFKKLLNKISPALSVTVDN